MTDSPRHLRTCKNLLLQGILIGFALTANLCTWATAAETQLGAPFEQFGEQEEPATIDVRLQRLEDQMSSVLEQNDRLADQNHELLQQNQELSGWLTNQHSFDPDGSGGEYVYGGYDQQLGSFALVRPFDPQRTPFALNFDLITQLRYTGFARSNQTWTDSTGVVQPVRNLNEIDVQRNWLSFSGYALDPKLRFLATIFSSSTTNATLFLGGIDYQFSKSFVLSAGYNKMPGSREWLDSYRFTLGADRTMATTFFRPNFSPGVWASGEPLEGLHYVAMLGNSFDGANLAANRLGTNMTFGSTVWWEPRGNFGPGPSDIEWHEEPTPRLGSSLTLSRENLLGSTAIQSNPEGTIFRLSDGTPLAETGALAPGVHVDSTSVQLWSIDAAVKYRGLSVSGEYYFRWLDQFRLSGGTAPMSSLFDHGGLGQVSYFVSPRKLEGFARASFVNGPFGGGNDWSGGVNWYVRGARSWRITFDATRINHSPADNILTGFRAGESGMLYQLQMLTDF